MNSETSAQRQLSKGYAKEAGKLDVILEVLKIGRVSLGGECC